MKNLFLLCIALLILSASAWAGGSAPMDTDEDVPLITASAERGTP